MSITSLRIMTRLRVFRYNKVKMLFVLARVLSYVKLVNRGLAVENCCFHVWLVPKANYDSLEELLGNCFPFSHLCRNMYGLVIIYQSFQNSKLIIEHTLFLKIFIELISVLGQRIDFFYFSILLLLLKTCRKYSLF